MANRVPLKCPVCGNNMKLRERVVVGEIEMDDGHQKGTLIYPVTYVCEGCGTVLPRAAD